MPYCFDTSALIHAWVRAYPIEIFPSFWAKFAIEISNGHIFVPNDVLIELDKKDDGLLVWLKVQLPDSAIIDLDENVQKYLRKIMDEHPKIVSTGNSRNAADPIVIAVSKAYGLIVVSQEAKSANPERTKIPNVCEKQNLECIDLMEFIRRSSFVI
jgi:Domain of unknown function (DUF4411)